MEKYTIGELLRFLLKKWWVVLLSIVTFIVLLTAPSLLKAQTEAGNYQYAYYYSQLVEFKNHAVSTEPIGSGNETVKRYVDYNDIWYRNVLLSDFIDTISSKYDMNLFNPEWQTMDFSQKAGWVRTVLTATAVPNTPNYEFALSLAVALSKSDGGYLATHARELFLDFIDYAAQASKVYSEDSSITLIGDMMQVSSVNENEAAAGAFSPKNLVLGGFLGIIFGVLLVGIWFLASRRIVSKQMFKQAYTIDTIENSRSLAYDITCYMIRQVQKRGRAALALSTTLDNQSVMEPILEELVRYGYRVGFANLTKREMKIPSGAMVVPADVCARLHTPGHAQELTHIAADYDYLVVLADTPATDAVSTEIMIQCACAVFVEKIGRSAKEPLKATLDDLNRADEQLPVCVAWE